MFYSWPIVVAADNFATKKSTIDMPMSSGVIHQVDIVFPDVADHDVRVQIFDASFQLWPSNRDGTVRGDAAVISFRDFYEMEAANNTLRGVAWLTDATKACTIWDPDRRPTSINFAAVFAIRTSPRRTAQLGDCDGRKNSTVSLLARYPKLRYW